MGYLKVKEPFTNLLTQGMVCKETTSCPQHGFLLPDEIDTRNSERVCKMCAKPITVGRVEKMSKSKKNVVDPQELIDRYGADTVRMFCLFASPPDKDLEWSEQGVEGGFRFLNRVWRLAVDFMPYIKQVEPYSGPPDPLHETCKRLYRKTHETIKRVTRDIEDRFHFNTAISAVMELVNVLQAVENEKNTPENNQVIRFAMESVALLLSPIVPHFAEELWEALGNPPSILLMSWPSYLEEALEKDELLIVIQVNGKLRSKFSVATDADEETIKQMALADDRIKKFIDGRAIKKVIYVKGKLVNIVV